jgi:hypothetical protein
MLYDNYYVQLVFLWKTIASLTLQFQQTLFHLTVFASEDKLAQ